MDDDDTAPLRPSSFLIEGIVSASAGLSDFSRSARFSPSSCRSAATGEGRAARPRRRRYRSSVIRSNGADLSRSPAWPSAWRGDLAQAGSAGQRRDPRHQPGDEARGSDSAQPARLPLMASVPPADGTPFVSKSRIEPGPTGTTRSGPAASGPPAGRISSVVLDWGEPSSIENRWIEPSRPRNQADWSSTAGGPAAIVSHELRGPEPPTVGGEGDDVPGRVGDERMLGHHHRAEKPGASSGQLPCGPRFARGQRADLAVDRRDQDRGPGRGGVARERLVELQLGGHGQAGPGRSSRPRADGASPPSRPGRRHPPSSGTGVLQRIGLRPVERRDVGVGGRRSRLRVDQIDPTVEARDEQVLAEGEDRRRQRRGQLDGLEFARADPDQDPARARLGDDHRGAVDLQPLRGRGREPEGPGLRQRLLDESAVPERVEADREVPAVDAERRERDRPRSSPPGRPARPSPGPSAIGPGRSRGRRPRATCPGLRCAAGSGRARGRTPAAVPGAGPASPRVQDVVSTPRPGRARTGPIATRRARSRARSWPGRRPGLRARSRPRSGRSA